MDRPPLQQGLPVMPLPTRHERTWGLLAHLLPLPAVWFPFGHIVVPLVIWLIKRDESPFVGDQAREALNFQISISLYGVIAGLLAWFCVGFILMVVIGAAWVVLAIIAAVRANEGVAYRYPLTFRLIG